MLTLSLAVNRHFGLLLAAYGVWGKVIFSQASVCLQWEGGASTLVVVAGGGAVIHWGIDSYTGGRGGIHWGCIQGRGASTLGASGEGCIQGVHPLGAIQGDASTG